MSSKDKEKFRRRIIHYQKAKQVIIDKDSIQNFIKIKEQIEILQDGPTSKKIDMVIEIGEEVIRYLEDIYGEDLEELKSEGEAIIYKIYEMINRTLIEIEKAKKEQYKLMIKGKGYKEMEF